MMQQQEQRRRFLQQILAFVPASVIVTGTTACSDNAKEVRQQREYEPAFFRSDEWNFLTTAVDHLIPADEHGPSATEAGIPEFIDRQMEAPYGHGKLWYMQGPFDPDAAPELGYQLSLTPRDIYRQGIKACNDWCGQQHDKVFAELDGDLQVQLLQDMEGGKIDFATVPATTFFQHLLSNTKEGYFADPIYGGNKQMGGWKMVGFPGARADYLDWVSRHNLLYPYGPASISGERG